MSLQTSKPPNLQTSKPPNRSLFLNARKLDGLEKKIDQGVLTKILGDFFRKPRISKQL